MKKKFVDLIYVDIIGYLLYIDNYKIYLCLNIEIIIFYEFSLYKENDVSN